MATLRIRSSATPLALAYAALVLYAALYPYTGWRWPPGQELMALARLPSTRYHTAFDVGSNLAGYVPLGALIVIAARRSGMRAAGALLLSIGAAALLSYATEVLQNFLPGRVPALEDFLLNAAGGAVGALLALALHAAGLVDRWHSVRERWFQRDAAGALALIALWPVGLLFPTPVPLGLGQVGERLREALAQALEDVPWAADAYALLAEPPLAAEPLRPLAETLLVALGLLGPCLVAYAVMRPGWRRMAVAGGAALVGGGAMTLSALLNFGPGHAFAWAGPTAAPGLACGMLAAVAAAAAPRRVAAGLGLMALTGLVAGVAQAPDDPYFAQSLQAWEQGRFVRFHGLAQWVGWLWPYAAMAWLLSRLAARGEGPAAR